MRRFLPLVIAITLAVGLWGSPASAAGRRDLTSYRGLGTWVDVFDYVPAFQNAGNDPAVTTASFADMAHLGVKTVYLQAAQDDERSPGDTIDAKLLGRMLSAAHKADLRVVAWYVPHFDDVNADLRRLRALMAFKSGGKGFDGLAVDIEYNRAVPDVDERNTALIDLSKRVRKAAGDRPVGAIVLEPVFLDVVSPDYWPQFPWRRLSSLYDVWLPMSYWTNRSADSGYKDGFKYTDENIRGVRDNLREKNAPVHAIGGIADSALPKDEAGFLRAVKKDGAIGWSMYDYNTTASSAWPQLRRS